MKIRFLIIFISLSTFMNAQTAQDSITFDPQKQLNAAQRLLSGNYGDAVTVGAYGEITYNQPEALNGEMDVQRLVLLFGYKFTDEVQFITEVEFEHVQEVYIEQAFVNYAVAPNLSIRGGLMLVPMGIINEYHEPTTYYGVERPSVDSNIVPTTWREIGLGLSGKYNEASLRYQVYMFNGFASKNGSKLLGGSNGLRNGRQKGAESTMNHVNFSGKLDYYGLPGLRLGLSGYFGRTQSDKSIEDIDGADVGVAMLGLDARYAYKRFSARGQFIHTNITDSEAYNAYYGSDLGSSLQGWYVEAAYNLLSQEKEQELVGFVRFEDFNTHASTEGNLAQNLSYDRNEITFGLTYKVASGAAFKADYQFKNTAIPGADTVKQLNLGFGIWF